ncbi:MAG: ABC transporter permease [Actinomycetota bacterium]|nr:ABC transporter permease [Actinomycetota bacterium]MDP2287650.1 ABC transporter permease [Actinomycetota bacterium]
MKSWVQGVRLVTERALTENLKSRAFKIVTLILLLISIAAVTLPQIISGGPTTYSLATVGAPPAALATALNAAGASGDFDVEYQPYPSDATVRDRVRNGDASAGLVGNVIYTASGGSGSFPALLLQSVVTMKTVEKLKAAGLSPAQVAELQAIAPPEQVVLGRTENEGRSGIGFLVGIVLYLALTFAGNAIATAVATEKSTRISEVLLAVLRPSQILVGTVVAVGLATLSQLLVLVAPLAIAVRVTDRIELPQVAASDLTLAVIWFVLGFALYAFVFAAAAALVDKVTEVTSAILPVSLVLLAGYLVAVTVVVADPSSAVSVFASIFPLSAPLAMPIRWASGDVPIYQLVLAMTLTAATALALVALASAIYARALLITGRRVKMREVVRS